MIIGVNGYAGSGKDTTGILIQYITGNVGKGTLEQITDKYEQHQWWLEESSGWEIKKWAGKLKTIASMLTGIPVEKFEDQEFKKTNLGSEWDCNPWGKVGTMYKQPMTVRDFLQRLGTDGLREGLHTNTWVNALMADYKPTKVQWSDGPVGGYKDGPIPNWIITDTRFPNEAEAIKAAGGIVIRIDRPGFQPINAHPSETALDNWDFDYKIANVSDRFALMQTLQNILEKENLL